MMMMVVVVVVISCLYRCNDISCGSFCLAG